MDCAKGTAVAALYDDLTVDILSRVPVKDVRRSKCVSKPWRDLIADPLHRKKLPQTLEGFFHGGDASEHDTYGHFTSLSAGSGECVPPVDPTFSFLTAKLPGVKHMVLLDSCNGLLLFGCTWEDKSGFIVCNPATEELVTVPASSCSCPPHMHRVLDESSVDGGKRFAHTYLMFDPVVSSHFHLVQFWEKSKEVETVHSYSSETRAWSDRSSNWDLSNWDLGQEGGEWGRKAIIDFTCGRALVNGLLHFIVYHKFRSMIVALDGEGKICTTICLPLVASFVNSSPVFLGESQGHLHCIKGNVKPSPGYISDYVKLSVWVLEDYDTKEWILKHKVSCSQLFGSFFLSCKMNFDIVAMHPDHNSIIFAQHWDRKLVSYYMDSKEVHALRSLGGSYLFVTPYTPCFMELPVLSTKD